MRPNYAYRHSLGILLGPLFLYKMVYNINVKNWSTNTDELKKDKDRFLIWKLEQLINFGLDGT